MNHGVVHKLILLPISHQLMKEFLVFLILFINFFLNLFPQAQKTFAPSPIFDENQTSLFFHLCSQVFFSRKSHSKKSLDFYGCSVPLICRGNIWLQSERHETYLTNDIFNPAFFSKCIIFPRFGKISPIYLNPWNYELNECSYYSNSDGNTVPACRKRNESMH